MPDREQIPVAGGGSLFIGPADVEECEVHSWPAKGLAKRLVKTMRSSHPKGINVCRECIRKAIKDARP